MKTVAVFGGTFDPIHFGHLRTALELKQTLALDEMRLVPCNVPAHRGKPHYDAIDRLKMVELAVASEPELICDPREIQREGVSYMVDTLESMREEMGESVALILVLGMDSFLSLPSWHQWELIPQLAHILVAARPGSSSPGHGVMERFLHAREVSDIAELKEAAYGRVLVVRTTPLDISSTRIREIIRQKRSPRYLLPESVWDYMERNILGSGDSPREY